MGRRPTGPGPVPSGGAFLALTLIGVLLPATAAAQQVEAREGDRVRVTITAGSEVVGDLVAVDGDLVVRAAEGTRFEIPLEMVEGIDVSRGKHRRFAVLFPVTVAFSAFVGGLVESGKAPFLVEPGGAFGDGARAGAVVGVPIGVALGLIRFEQWEDASFGGFGDGMSVSVGPSEGGVGLSVGIPVGR